MQASSIVDLSDPKRTIAEATSSRTRGWSNGSVVKVAGACLIEAILILGLVTAGLGLGDDSRSRTGPDRPRPPAMTPPQALPPSRPGIAP
jgi:hypothetical protein